MGSLTEHLKVTRQTYIVVTTRGSSVDAEGLPGLLDSDAAYIGVIGSRKRWMTTVKALKEKGVAEDAIAKVHSPMGLELNAETPEEIAVSIMAEIMMLKDKGTGKMMKE
jgi:xanthine dehydrogenase accessory factor